jgi:multiple sugar transport system substrate-binding protein
MWVEYALGAKGQEVLAASGRSVPSLKAVAESPVFLAADEPPASSKVFVDALSQMPQLPVTANWAEVEGRTDDVLESLYYGRLELDEALARLAKETDGQF